MNRPLPIKEVAARLGVSRDTVEREMGRRNLAVTLIGKRRFVTETAIVNYQKARTIEARRPRA